MAKELTADDLAVYKVEITVPDGRKTLSFAAAYTANEPGWLLLKDHQHRTVAQFNIGVVVMVVRGDPAMAEAQDPPGRVITR